MMNKPEWILIFFACISCLISGGTQPAFGVILSKLSVVKLNAYELFFDIVILFIKVFEECDSETQEKKVLLYVLLFLALGVISWIALLVQVSFLILLTGILYLHMILDIN